MPVMPDTRIPMMSGLSEGGPSSSPFQTLGALMQIKEQQQQYQHRQREAEMQRRALEDDDAIRTTLTQYERPEDALDDLWRSGRGAAATKLGRDIYNERTAKLQAQDAELKNVETRLGMAAQIGGSITDDTSYQTVRPQLLKILEPIYGQGINDALPTQFGDGARIKQLIEAGTTRTQQIQQQRDLISQASDAYTAGLIPKSEWAKVNPKFAAAAKGGSEWSPNGLEAQSRWREMIGRAAVNATDANSWNQALAFARENGAPEVTVKEFGEWDANAIDRARNLGLTLPQRATAEAQARSAATAETRAEAAALAEQRRQQAAGGGGRAPGGLTEGQQYTIEDKLEAEIAETEKWVKEEYDKDAPTMKQVNDDGEEEDVPIPFGYQRVTGDAAKQYVKRRVDIENKARRRLQGLPPINVAARAAVQAGDAEGYEKLREVYSGITNGVGKLEDVVPWPNRNANTYTPEAQADRRLQMRDVLAELRKPQLTPQRRAELEKTLIDLRNAQR